MTRFFMDVNQSIGLIFNASYHAENGETFILKMPSVKIGVLANVFLEVAGHPSNDYEVIGTRPGEKLHEELLLENEEGAILEDDEFFLRLPLKLGDGNILDYKKKGFKISKSTRFRSDNKENLMGKESVEKVLMESKYMQ